MNSSEITGPEDIAGAWSLVSFVLRYTDGRPDVHPFGRAPHGLIIYESSGTMSAVLSHEERTHLGSQTMEWAHTASQDAKACAFDTYVSYAGTWSLEGDRVTHTVDYALVPELVGQTLTRQAILDGTQLVLRYHTTTRSGVTCAHVLRWRRPSKEHV